MVHITTTEVGGSKQGILALLYVTTSSILTAVSGFCWVREKPQKIFRCRMGNETVAPCGTYNVACFNKQPLGRKESQIIKEYTWNVGKHEVYHIS